MSLRPQYGILHDHDVNTYFGMRCICKTLPEICDVGEARSKNDAFQGYSRIVHVYPILDIFCHKPTLSIEREDPADVF